MRTKCTNCRDFFPKGTERWSNQLQRICSEECLNEYMEARRLKSRAASKKAPKKYSKRKLEQIIPPELRHAVKKRDGHCRCCGRQGHEIHHVLFRSQGGANERSNLIFLCHECHHTHAHGPEAKRYRRLFRAYIWLAEVEGRSYSWEHLVDQYDEVLNSKIFRPAS